MAVGFLSRESFLAGGSLLPSALADEHWPVAAESSAMAFEYYLGIHNAMSSGSKPSNW